VHVTVVEPDPKVAPDAGLHDTGLPSDAVGAGRNVTVAPAALVACTEISAGTVTTGPVVSATVISKPSEVVFCSLSVAVHATVVVPRANSEPDDGVQTTTGVGSKVSVAEGVNVTFAPAALVASAVMSAGTVTTGGVVSATVTVWVVVAVLESGSVTVQVIVVWPTGNEAGASEVTTSGVVLLPRSETGGSARFDANNGASIVPSPLTDPIIGGQSNNVLHASGFTSNLISPSAPPKPSTWM